MTCPRCDATIKASMRRCPKRGLPLSYADKVENRDRLPLKSVFIRAGLVLAAIMLTLVVALLIEEPIRIRRQNREITKKYVNQVVETLTLDSGYKAHALTFFGEDGDCVYLEELGQSYMFVGGIARVEVPDYIWFDKDPTLIDNALITFSPVYISASGQKTRIPVFSVEVEVPEAPVTEEGAPCLKPRPFACLIRSPRACPSTLGCFPASRRAARGWPFSTGPHSSPRAGARARTTACWAASR